MNKEVIGGVVGTSMSIVGTGLQPNEVLQTISLILTIIGALITIIMGLVNWYKKVMEDNKITKEEYEEGVDIVKNGVEDIKEIIDKKDKK